MSGSKPSAPRNVDGEAVLFSEAAGPLLAVVSSSTGCVAARDKSGHIQVVHWCFRLTGGPPIRVEKSPWMALWSCLSPWDSQPAGFLTGLQCEGLALTHLDVRSTGRLTQLYCRHNQLDRLDLSGLAKLTWLDCSFNRLSLLDLRGCIKLQQFKANGNPGLSIQTDRDLSLQTSAKPPRRRRTSSTQASLFDL